MVYALSVWALPSEFTGIFVNDPTRVVKNWHLFFCVASGLWGGLVIGLTTEYYTSNRYAPVQASVLYRCTACTSLLCCCACGMRSPSGMLRGGLIGCACEAAHGAALIILSCGLG